jgi:2,3-bisphosphoglycerate-independent phosphoglycerate mutase
MRAAKYVILLGDGMPDGDAPTPLMTAATPYLDALAREGTVGSVKTTPDGFEPGSDVTNMGIIGYAPEEYYTGRSPLEAGAMGVAMGPDDVAFRLNLVTLTVDAKGVVMDDFSAGHIETDDAHEIIATLNERMSGDGVSFHPGVQYRHLMLWRNGIDRMKTTPPHDISDRNIKEYLPNGEGADRLRMLMNESQMVLKDHPVNKRRVAAGKKPATSVWLWGQGKKPSMPKLADRNGIDGAMITAVDLMRGIATFAGMKVIDVPGATGWIDTNYEGKAAACLEALKEVDFVYLHVESPDEAGHAGSYEKKVRAIEDFDKKIVGAVLDGVKAAGYDVRVMVLSDHPTPVALKTHTLSRVPFVIWPPLDTGSAEAFDERIVDEAALVFDSAVALNRYFIEGSR